MCDAVVTLVRLAWPGAAGVTRHKQEHYIKIKSWEAPKGKGGGGLMTISMTKAFLGMMSRTKSLSAAQKQNNGIKP